MSYQVLYRRFRPTTFADIAGQEHITEILKNQIKNNRVAHAYLFCGSRGTGKTTTAKVFANAVNCFEPVDGEPCGKCAYCTQKDMSDVVEIDAASNRGIDQIRLLRDEVNYMPALGKYRVYIIDEVHMLTTEAFNALLKTLEEPPEHIVFIFATTEVNKLLPTILSRCQRYDFARIPVNTLIARMKEVLEQIDVSYEDEALAIIAENSDGALRDALSFLDKAINFGNGNTLKVDDVIASLGLMGNADVINIGQSIIKEDINTALVYLNNTIQSGADCLNIINQLIEYFRDGMICLNTVNPSEIIQKGSKYIASVKDAAKLLDNECFIIFINSLSKLKNDARYVNDVRSLLECEIIRLSDREKLIGDYSAVAKIEQLEKRLAGLSEKVKELANGEIKVIREVAVKEVTPEPEEPEPREHQSSLIANPAKNYDCDKTEIRRLQEAISFAANYVLNRDRKMILSKIYENLRVYGYTNDTIYVYPLAMAVPIMDSYERRGGKELLEKAVYEKLGERYSIIVTAKPTKKPDGPAKNEPRREDKPQNVPVRPNLRTARKSADIEKIEKQVADEVVETEETPLTETTSSAPAIEEAPLTEAIMQPQAPAAQEDDFYAEAYSMENIEGAYIPEDSFDDIPDIAPSANDFTDGFDDFIDEVQPKAEGPDESDEFDDFLDTLNDTFGDLTEL